MPQLRGNLLYFLTRQTKRRAHTMCPSGHMVCAHLEPLINNYSLIISFLTNCSVSWIHKGQ